jgi:hypothetical protein
MALIALSEHSVSLTLRLQSRQAVHNYTAIFNDSLCASLASEFSGVLAGNAAGVSGAAGCTQKRRCILLLPDGIAPWLI